MAKRGRKPVPPLFTGPIPENAEYRRMVEKILEDKRRRDVIADILADKATTANRGETVDTRT